MAKLLSKFPNRPSQAREYPQDCVYSLPWGGLVMVAMAPGVWIDKAREKRQKHEERQIRERGKGEKENLGWGHVSQDLG